MKRLRILLLCLVFGGSVVFAQPNYSQHDQYEYARKLYVEHCASCHDGHHAPTAEQMQEKYKGKFNMLKYAMRFCRPAMKLTKAQRRAIERWLSETK